MKYRILIHVDSLRRDAAACNTLAEILRARGGDVVVSGQQTTGHYLKYWRPHLILHTAASKIVNYSKLGIISPENRPIIHYLPQEGRPTSLDAVSFCYQPFQQNGYDLVDKVYVWNDVHRDWLIKNSPLSTEQIRVVGGYRLDLAKYGTSPRLDDRPPVVGFIGRFTAINPHDADYGLHLFARTEPQLLHKLPKLSAQIQACLVYSYLITTLIEQTDFKISLRPHHNEYPYGHYYAWAKKQFGDRIEIDESFSFYEWSVSKLALVTMTSSTFVEAYVARTPLISVDRFSETMLSRWYNPSTMDIYKSFPQKYLPETAQEFVALLNRLRENFSPASCDIPAGDLVRQQYMWPYEGSSLRAIADGIWNSLETMDAKQRSRRSRLPKFSGDAVYMIGMAHWARIGQLRPKMQYVYNNRLHGRDPFYRTVAERIEHDTSFVHPSQ